MNIGMAHATAKDHSVRLNSMIGASALGSHPIEVNRRVLFLSFKLKGALC